MGERRNTVVRRARSLVWLGAVLWGCLASARSQAQGPELLRYEPPPVDAIYPERGPVLAGQREPSSANGEAPPSASPADAPSAPGAPPEVSARAAARAEPRVAAQPPPAPDAASEDAADYGAQANITREELPGAHTVSMEAARDLPGAFGDPLRVLDALPGVVPISSGLPYGYLRGAPPAAQGYIYDDIPLPQLFHAAFLPAVIHPRAMSEVKLYGGVPPTEYGRRAGGAMVVHPAKPSSRLAGEVELRLLDVGGWLNAPVGEGNLMVSGRLGYPKLALATAEALGMLDPGTKINYWDGQVRHRAPLGLRDHVETVWLGSFDDTTFGGLAAGTSANRTRLQFHRVETRLVHRTEGGGQLGAALRFGYDHSELGSATSVRAYTFGPRFWSRVHVGRHMLRMGADLYATKGDIENGDGTLSSFDGDLRVELPDLAEAPARNQGGVFSELNLVLGRRVRADLGARVDYWSTLSRVQVSVDPRLRLAIDLSDSFTVHAAAGMAHQPAVFLLPLPGLTDVALSRGLSRSIQSEAGGEITLSKTTRLKIQGYYHTYTGLLLPELVQDAAIRDNSPLATAEAYGLEVFLDRQISERISGWLSYTYGFATADSGPDVVGEFKPDFDVRHVLNVVLLWRIWRGLTLGLRGQARSGRVVEQLNPRYTQRLPWFARADARIQYGWSGRLAEMKVYAEILNASLQREYLDADCLLGQCIASQAPLVTIPNVGVRAEF